MNRKGILAVLLAVSIGLVMTSCGKNDSGSAEKDINGLEWSEIEDLARGSTVTFYGWGGDENRNKWLSGEVADYLKENYDITLKPVGMDINDILAKLSADKEAGSETGDIDMIWINGENFYSAKEKGLLYGPFTDSLPNMEKYVDLADDETSSDFCKPIDGYEAPYGKAQMIMYADSSLSAEFPKTADEFMDFCKAHPGKVTYPALPDFTGSAFVRNLIYEKCGSEQFADMKADKETVRKAIEPALDYLRALNPYLWKEGKVFPESSTKLSQMFQDGEVVMNMSYSSFEVAQGIGDGTLKDTTETFIFDGGTIGNTNYLAVAYDAPNKAGALVAINAMLSAELQLSQYEKLKTLPVLDGRKLSAEEKKAFEKVDIGKGVLSQNELLNHRLPEMPADLVPIIEDIWLEEVVGK